jgi:hypothetical protein
MKDIIKGIVRLIGGRALLIFLTLTFTGYMLFELWGLFRLEPATLREVFHSIPSKILSMFFAVNAVAGILNVCMNRSLKRQIGSVLFFLSLILLVAGLWVSVYTRFEGKIIRSPWQTFNAFPSDYIQRSLYHTRYSDLPQVGLTFDKPEISTTPDLKKIKKIDIAVTYAGRTTGGKILRGRLSSLWPFISDWTLLRITDFGYQIKYVLYDLNEKVLQSRYFDMKLFPPGAEESFETVFLGYVFYVRCYPDYVDRGGKSETVSPYPNNPACNLRIVRNKDIVYNGLLKPEGKVRFDNSIIALPDLQIWVEVEFVRDFGLPIAAAGLVLLVIGVVLIMVRKTDSAEALKINRAEDRKSASAKYK